MPTEAQAMDGELARAEGLFAQGEALLAYQVVAEAMEACPGDLRLHLLMARIHLKLGFTRKAIGLLEGIPATSPWRPEASALLGRASKDLWRRSPGDVRLLREAIRHYGESFQRNPSIWAGINLATLRLLDGQRRDAQDLAQRFAAALREALAGGGLAEGDRYWHLATLGEALLVLDDAQGARQAFRDALQLPAIPREYHLSTIRNLELLSGTAGAAGILDLFPTPTVLCFGPYGRKVLAGQAGAAHPEPVLRRLREERHVHSAVCGLADPWDLLVAETLIAMGLGVHVTVPYEPEAMFRDYWEPMGVPMAQIEALLASAAKVMILGHWPGFADAASVAFANRITDGYGRLRASQVEGRLLWLGPSAAGPEPAGEFRSPGEFLAIQEGLETSMEACPAGPAKRQAMAILFADVVKFSRLTEAQTFLFVEHFLGMVAALIRQDGFRPAYRNTWGDGLVFDFEDPEEAGRFALLLSRRVRETDWFARGLVEGLNLRISLHAGPVYVCTDPVMGTPTYTGHHVVTSARMEPVTPPGEVFVSENFAALLANHGSERIEARYSGRIPLPKNAGLIPVFALHSR